MTSNICPPPVRDASSSELPHAARAVHMTPRPRAPEHFDSKERDLGLDAPITRRDFLNSTLLASGAALLGSRAPPVRQAPNATSPAWEGPGGVGDYARSHGNMWSAVTT